ncbi:MAG TPA: hypothetical protein VGH74_07635 [Planctomycetaceae bacterium]|jgi:hypothetical protein
MSTHHTTASIAASIGCTPDTVSRVARANQIGEQVGTTWIFTPADADRLRGLIRPGPGRPATTDRPKRARKQRENAG